ncbi:MAG: hypothetical protein IKX23_06505 [Treponema sp.]|nr:hypothetical protein [Treponema sp.]
MKNHIKIIIAGLISSVVFLSCIYIGPGNFEEEPGSGHSTTEVLRINTEQDLKDFLSAYKFSKAKLNNNINLSKGINLTKYTKELDLRGYNITSTGYIFNIGNNAGLTIINSSSFESELNGTYSNDAVIINYGKLSINGGASKNIKINSNYMGITNYCEIDILRCNIYVHSTIYRDSTIGVYNVMKNGQYGTINELDSNIRCEFRISRQNKENDTTAVYNEGYIKTIRKGTYEAYSTAWSFGLYNAGYYGNDSGTIDLIETGVNFFADGVVDQYNVTEGEGFNSNEGRIKTNRGNYIPSLNNVPEFNIRSAAETKPVRIPKKPEITE